MNFLCKIFFSVLKLYHRYHPTRIHRAMILSFMSTFCEICLTLEIQYSWRWKYDISADENTEHVHTYFWIKAWLYQGALCHCGCIDPVARTLSGDSTSPPSDPAFLEISWLPSFSWAITRNILKYLDNHITIFWGNNSKCEYRS